MNTPRCLYPNYPRFSRRFISGLTALALSVFVVHMSGSDKYGDPAQADVPPGLKNTVQVMVEMSDVPAADVYAKAYKAAKDKADAERANALAHPDAPASKAILNNPKKVQISDEAKNEVNNHVEKLKQAQQSLLPSLTGGNVNGHVIYSAQRAYNGIAIAVSPDKLSDIAKMSGVKAIHPLHPKSPSSTFSDIDFLRARTNPGGPWSTLNKHGEGIKIADIDSGLDFVHRNFGGSGNYTGISDTNGGNQFPSAKVPGGYDFAGDAYNANIAGSMPNPDPVPWDGDPSGSVAGHGTATASLISGFGENNDGTTYTGAYDATHPSISNLKIAPGFAPKALLYPLRVFGSSGSTNLVGEAIEWAVANDMDVINMSLGSNEGYPDDPDAVAASNAASMGIIVCSAAGNAGDSYYIHSSPAAAKGTLSIAASFNDQSGFIADSSVTANSPTIATSPFHSIYGSPSPRAGTAGVTGDMIYAVPNNAATDGAAGGTTPLANAAQIAGKICLIDRGTSSFIDKCKKAQAAGAIAVVVNNFNNPGADPIIMALDSTITIPCVMITRSNRDDIVAAAGPVNSTTGAFTTNVNVTIKDDNFVVSHGGAAPDTMPAYSSRGPSLPESAVKPDVTAPAEVVSVATNHRGTAVSNFNGTSSATPHVSGAMALLRQLHPTWSVQELNALICNTATHDLTATTAGGGAGVGRVGGGRIDLTNAANSNVVAYNGTDAGEIGVSFGVVETPVNGTSHLTKNITLVNKGGSSITYNISIQNNPALAGTSFTPGVNSIVVPANSTRTVAVSFDASGSALKHRKESGVAFQLPGPVGRQWLTEAAGYVKFTPASGSSPILRVAVYAAPKPVSNMHVPTTPVTVKNGSTGTVSLPLTGNAVNTGSAYGLGFDILSLMKPVELQYAGTTPSTPDANVLKYVGVTSDYLATGKKAGNTVITFAIEGFGDQAVPEFNSSDKEVFIDTNHDGNLDFAIFLTSIPNGTSHSNSYRPVLVDLKTGTQAPIPFPYETNLLDPVFNPDGSQGGKDTNSFNNGAVLVPVPVNMLLPATAQGGGGPTGIDYLVATFDRTGAEVDETPLLSYDIANPSLSFGGAGVEPFYFSDMTSTLSVQYTAKNFKGNDTLGAWVVHRHNAAGSRSDVVPFSVN